MLAKRGINIQAGDVLIVFHGHDDLRPLTVTPGAELHCKNGKFKHNDMIGVPYGSRIRGISNTKADPTIPTILLLQNCADLWTKAVPHRTQIIYATDIATIVMNLRVKPGSFVAEAGTGSGSLTHSFARAVAPSGQVFTFDFHKGRAMQARDEFRENGVGHLVTSGWRDVCTTATQLDAEDQPTWDDPLTTEPRAGFGLPMHHVDALFLDVPAPWLAIDNVLHVLKPGGILCTFSPCIEQTQRTCERLREEPNEFIDVRTAEVLTRFFDPVFKRTRLESEAPVATESHLQANGSTNDSGAPPTTADAAPRTQRPKYRDDIKFRPAAVSKGHSAYLTFARRRLPRVPATTALAADAPDEVAASQP